MTEDKSILADVSVEYTGYEKQKDRKSAMEGGTVNKDRLKRFFRTMSDTLSLIDESSAAIIAHRFAVWMSDDNVREEGPGVWEWPNYSDLAIFMLLCEIYEIEVEGDT